MTSPQPEPAITLLGGTRITVEPVPGSFVAPAALPPGDRTMVDSAFPLKNPPATDIVLIYAGGDTPHPWSQAEIDAQPGYRWKLRCRI